jgi:hypothetical protein
MVLDLTRELIEWQTYGSPRETRAAMRRVIDYLLSPLAKIASEAAREH